MNNPHQNARTCFYSREQIVERYQNGEKAPSIAAAFGISVRTVYKWLKRFREHGPSELIARSSAPRTCSNSYMAGWRTLIVRLRQLRLTADEIGEVLGFPRSTVAHALKAWGLNRLSRLTPPEPIHRYERDTPGDLLHLDIKKLGRFNKTGHRVTGHHRRKRSRGVGYDYVHVAIDDHSRVAYVEVLPDERGYTCAMFLVRAARWFASKSVLVRHRSAQFKLKEAPPGQTIPDHEFHLRVAQIVLRLKNEGLEHRNWVKQRATALGPVAIAQPIHQPDAEILEIHCRLKNPEWITVLAQAFKMIRKAEKTARIHDRSSSKSVNQNSPPTRGF